jgi:transcriptional regulator with XRE-family HTH domain
MGRAPATLTPYASVAHFLGAELRLRREDTGLSINQLAPRVLASPDLLAKVERAERFPSADLTARCDQELAADGYLIRLHGLALAERDTARPYHDIARLAASLHSVLRDFPQSPIRNPTEALVDRIDDLLCVTEAVPPLRPRRGQG